VPTTPKWRDEKTWVSDRCKLAVYHVFFGSLALAVSMDPETPGSWGSNRNTPNLLRNPRHSPPIIPRRRYSMKTIAVVLSGCGVFDGAEIHESVLTLYFLKRKGQSYQCFAPDKAQHHVTDHIANKEAPGETRNVLTESARIARGDIRPLADYDPANFDAIIFPGGLGVGINLFSFSVDGVDCSIDETVQKAILDTNAAGKPVAAMCLAPVLLARAFRDTGKHITLTAGQDVEALSSAIKEMGASHRECRHDEICVDVKNKVVTAPAYTISKDIVEAAAGIEKLVEKLIEWCLAG